MLLTAAGLVTLSLRAWLSGEKKPGGRGTSAQREAAGCKGGLKNPRAGLAKYLGATVRREWTGLGCKG